MKKIILLLAIIAIVLSKGIEIKLRQRNRAPSHKQMMRHNSNVQKNSKSTLSKLIKKHGAKVGHYSVFRANLANYMNIEYVGTVKIGGKMDKYTVIFDTGSNCF